MLKKMSMLTAFILTVFLLPSQIFAESEEVAQAEPTGMLYYTLVILSFLTLIYMIFLMVKDNN